MEIERALMFNLLNEFFAEWTRSKRSRLYEKATKHCGTRQTSRCIQFPVQQVCPGHQPDAVRPTLTQRNRGKSKTFTLSEATIHSGQPAATAATVEQAVLPPLTAKAENFAKNSLTNIRLPLGALRNPLFLFYSYECNQPLASASQCHALRQLSVNDNLQKK